MTLTYLERSGDEDNAKNELEEIFKEEIDSKRYESFVFMYTILCSIWDREFASDLSEIYYSAYKQCGTAFLIGKWIRTDDSSMNGAVLKVVENDGALVGIIEDLSNTQEYGFKEGDIKWKNIVVYDFSTASYEDCATSEDRSTVEYHTGVMTLDCVNQRSFVKGIFIIFLF